MADNLEKLSADILDEDFTSIFRPIHRLQAVIGNLNVKIEHGFVTPPSKAYTLYSIFILTVNVSSQFLLTTECESTKYLFIDDLYLKSFNVCVHVCDYLLFVYQRLCVEGTAHCELYVKLQKIDRDLYMREHNRRVNRGLSRLSTITSVVITIVFIFYTAFHNTYLIKGFCPFAIFMGFSSLMTIVDVVLSLFILYYLQIRVEFIRKELENIRRLVERNSKFHERANFHRGQLNETVDGLEKKLNGLVLGTHDILTAMADFSELFQMKISYFTFMTLMWALMVIELSIILVKHQAIFSYMLITNTETYFVLIQLCSYYSFLYVCLCIITGLITSKLEKSRKLCIDIVYSSEGVVKRNAKRLLLLLDVRNVVSIYDIYTLDARLLARTVGIITTYTVIILQFYT